ncbi:hypothetical protein [Candidatus Regiella endosymbiont of Tuberolachnus salignus]|uniref:hypothetical protein n=1 Tax=Candidatus Regiella endosymbiont of Tuberolachnus salignus TaxID=3077956 RepID=UPI0030D4D8FD
MNFELRQGSQGVRPMSVDILRDSASTRSQRRRNLKGEGYMPKNICHSHQTPHIQNGEAHLERNC